MVASIFHVLLTPITMEHNAYAPIQETNACLGNTSMGLVVFISLDPAPKAPHGMELTVFLIAFAHLDFMVLLINVFLCLKGVCPLQFIQVEDVCLLGLVLKDLISAVDLACLTCLVQMGKLGVIVW